MNVVLESLLFGRALVAFAKLHVGDISIQTLHLTDCQIGKAVVVAVCSELPDHEIIRRFANALHVLFCTLQHGSQIVVILIAERFGMHNKLMLAVHQRLCVIALDHAM